MKQQGNLVVYGEVDICCKFNVAKISSLNP